MMEVHEYMFILALLTALAMMLLKIYNGLHEFNLYQWSGTIMSTVIYTLAAGMLYITAIIGYESRFMVVMIVLCGFLTVLVWGFTFVEIAILMSALAIGARGKGRRRSELAGLPSFFQ